MRPGWSRNRRSDPVYEMVDMMQASRSSQANLSVVQTANTAALKTIDLLK